MSIDISVFPVALLENAVTRPIAYQGEEVFGHLSDEPRRCTFPMNCLYSTCGLTLIPDGWSATLRATCKAAENDCLERRNSTGHSSAGSGHGPNFCLPQLRRIK